MSTPTHIATGTLLTHLFASQGWITPQELPNYTLWSALWANGPDLDILRVGRIRDHRRGSLLHVPATWFLAFFIFWVYLSINRQSELIPYFILALVNVLGHFILDTFNKNTGITWLAPWSLKEFSFLRIQPFCVYNIPKFVKYYIFQPLALVEAVIIIYGGMLLFRPYTGIPKVTKAWEKTSPVFDIIRFGKVNR